MTITSVRFPTDDKSPAFVLAAAEARAVALAEGHVLLTSVSSSDTAYLYHDDHGWHLEAATLLDQPAWADKVLRLITRHGR